MLFQFKTGRRMTDRIELAQVPLGTGFLISFLAGTAVMSLISVVLHINLI